MTTEYSCDNIVMKTAYLFHNIVMTTEYSCNDVVMTTNKILKPSCNYSKIAVMIRFRVSM